MGSEGIVRKHLGQLFFEDIVLLAGADLNTVFYHWIRDTLDRSFTRKSGAVVEADFNLVARSRREFFDAVITEVGFPALDAASKEAAFFTVVVTPESTRLRPGSGSVAGIRTRTRSWLAANFRLAITGLEPATTHVDKIDALVVKQPLAEDSTGDERDPGAGLPPLEVPNLVVRLPEAHAKPFVAWHEDFVIRGNSGPEHERYGRLEYLSANLVNVLFTLEFFNLGIFRLVPERIESGQMVTRRVRAEMYCEQMRFSVGSVPVA